MFIIIGYVHQFIIYCIIPLNSLNDGQGELHKGVPQCSGKRTTLTLRLTITVAICHIMNTQPSMRCHKVVRRDIFRKLGFYQLSSFNHEYCRVAAQLKSVMRDVMIEKFVIDHSLVCNKYKNFILNTFLYFHYYLNFFCIFRDLKG